MGLRVRLTLALLLTIATLAVAPRPADAADEIADALAFVNEARAQVGAAPLALHPALRQAAQSHVDYYRANIGDPDLAGMGLHQEKPGRPGFTGVEPEDRARAAGYPGRAINENAGLTGALIPFPLACGNDQPSPAAARPALSRYRLRRRQRGAHPVRHRAGRRAKLAGRRPTNWIAWPPDGAEGIGLSYSGESPNPFPGQRYPVGYPITLGYFGPGAVQFTGAALRSADGASVPIVFRQGDGWHSRRTALIVAVEPLARGGVYAVEARGTANGRRSAAAGASPPSARPRPARPHRPRRPTRRHRAPRRRPPRRRRPRRRRGWPPPTRRCGRSGSARTANSRRPAAPAAGCGDPDVFASRAEPYAEAPGGQRTVYYFDKSRMEITDPVADRRSPWFVTNGLLVREMVTGTVQVGHGASEERGPADLPAVGDAANNPKAPTYATFLPLAGRDPAERRARVARRCSR